MFQRLVNTSCIYNIFARTPGIRCIRTRIAKYLLQNAYLRMTDYSAFKMKIEETESQRVKI